MIDVNALKRARQKVVDEMRKITNAAEAREDKRMTEDEGKRWSILDAEAIDYQDRIAKAERMNSLELENSDLPDPKEKKAKAGEDEYGFRSFGEFLLAVHQDGIGHRRDPRLNEERAPTGQNTTNPAEGGFLVGTQHVAGLYKRAYERAALASRCRKIAVGAGVDGIAMNAIDETSRATGSRWGGIRAYRRAEAETVTASKLKLREMKLDLEDLMCICYATDRSLQDAVQLEGLINEAASEEIAWVLDNEILNGTGAGQCLGITNSDCAVSIAKESAQVADTIVYENVNKMRTRLWAPSMTNAAWFINQDCQYELSTMAFVVGTGGVPVYLPATGISGSPYDTMYGRPVIPIEQASTVGTVGDINLLDLSQYLLIDKGNIQNDVSMHVRFLYAEKVFRFIFRVNGQPLWNLPLTPANGTNTVSPFITLASRD